MTMIDLDIGRFRKARVWQGELPSAGFESSVIKHDSFRATTQFSDVTEPRLFCIEYKVPLGARVGYGLLGSTFKESNSKSLEVSIFVKDRAWEVYMLSNSFASPDLLKETLLLAKL